MWKVKVIIQLIILNLVLVSCAPGQLLGPSFTETPTATQTATSTPTLMPSLTPIPTQTNTPSPTRTSTPTGPEKVSWNDAWRKVGTVAKVCGEAVTVAILLDGRRIVNLGEIPSNGGVIVVITNSTIFTEKELNNFYSKDICVTGEITQDGNNFGIYVTNRNQIEMNE